MRATEKNPEALEIAKGLYQSKVFVQRPPSSAQRNVYHVSGQRHSTRPLSAVARVSSERTPSLTPSPPKLPKSYLSWRQSSSFVYCSKAIHPDSAPQKDEKQTEAINTIQDVYKQRMLPKGLLDLQKWLVTEVSDDWPASYRPENSFVLVPSMETKMENLPEVPLMQGPYDQLPYEPEPQTVKPQKQKLKKCSIERDVKSKKMANLEIPTGAKGRSTSDSDTVSCQSSSSSSLLKVSKKKESSKNSRKGVRTAKVIKREIRDLANLIKGIGNPRSSSVVARYQHDINNLRLMTSTTMDDCNFVDTGLVKVTKSIKTLKTNVARQEAIISRRNACFKELEAMQKAIQAKRKKGTFSNK